MPQKNSGIFFLRNINFFRISKIFLRYFRFEILKKATVNSVRVSEEEVKDVHAEEVLKKHVIDEKNFLGVPTALDENDMDSPLSHYFINSR